MRSLSTGEKIALAGVVIAGLGLAWQVFGPGGDGAEGGITQQGDNPVVIQGSGNTVQR